VILFFILGQVEVEFVVCYAKNTPSVVLELNDVFLKDI